MNKYAATKKLRDIDKPISFGTHDFCMACESCAKFCPSGAVPKGGPSCGGHCIAVCPWNKPMNWFHNSVRWLAIHSPIFIKRVLVWADEITYQRKKKIKTDKLGSPVG